MESLTGDQARRSRHDPDLLRQGRRPWSIGCTRSAVNRTSRFLRACRREPVDATPIWLMRQAGRYMPEYRALRERYGILEIIKQPELACEVTLQPINAFDLDAAIIFADILPPLEGMGLRTRIRQRRGSASSTIPSGRQPMSSDCGHLPGGGARRSRSTRSGWPERARSARHSADRIQRRAVHPGQLRDRGRRRAGTGSRQAFMMSEPDAWACADDQAQRWSPANICWPRPRAGAQAFSSSIAGAAS